MASEYSRAQPPAWAVGDHLTHRFNPDMGIGRVIAVDGRAIVVHFPATGTKLRIASTSDALVRVEPEAHAAAREQTLFDRLARGDVDHAKDLLIRLDVLRLLAMREARGLGSFLGGRVRLFPHQLYVAERASAADPVRWLLADEVGLGKTIEACLILNRLVHAGKVERCLVVAPDALTVQWLGELWRKYHQVFTLLDERRLADVAKDFGADFNPFDVHRRAVIALETLVARPDLTEQAVRAGIDLLIVDEAQRIRRPPGHPGDPGWRAVAPIASLGRHVLLLSATPLDDDAHGFFRLLQLLRPDEFPEDTAFEDRLASGTPLPPCTSSTRRSDIGGLPPRVGLPVAVPEMRTWQPRLDVESALRALPAPNAVALKRKAERIWRAMASGAALVSTLGPADTDLRTKAEAMDATDPRVRWLAAEAPAWKAAGEKTLVFVQHRETLEMLRTALSHRAQLATGVFHEELTPARRDTEVARFREADGPSLMVCTECGGEGRNFEFCRRLVLFDLPPRPTAVEQRIGRLDRIGRRIRVEVVYFQPPDGVGADVVRLFETLGVFREPLAGLEPQLVHIEDALDAIAVDPTLRLTDERLEQLLTEARAARTRIREAAYQQLHRDPYRADMAEGILARVPAQLDALMERAVVTAAHRLGFRAEHLRGRRIFAIEHGNESLVDSLPGVPVGAAYVGTFEREEAVEDEGIDFFASGHALVEGILAHVSDSRDGRVARLMLEIPGLRGAGVIAIYKDGPLFEVVALDAAGQPKPEWARAIEAGGYKARRMPEELWERHDWGGLVRRCTKRMASNREPHAVAAIVIS